jgi:hypothetical protein
VDEQGDVGVRRRQQGQLDQHERLQALATSLLVGLLLALPAGASAAQTGDRVTGDAIAVFGGRFTLDVQGSETGANPTGTYRVPGPPTWEATAKCMRVAGDRATLGFSIDATRNLLLWVRDVAGPGTVYAKIVGSSDPLVCPDPVAGPDPSLAALDISGYIYVDDVQPSPPPGTDSVTGAIEKCFFEDADGFCGFLGSFSPGAVSERLGGHPTGELSFDESGATPGSITRSDAAVTCLSVSGHQAIVGFTGSRHRNGASERIIPYAGLARVTDDAHGDRVEFAYDTGTANGPSLPGPTECATFPGPFPASGGSYTFDNASGDVVVHDALSRSQARAACKFERAYYGIAAFRAKYGGMRNCVAHYMS